MDTRSWLHLSDLLTLHLWNEIVTLYYMWKAHRYGAQGAHGRTKTHTVRLKAHVHITNKFVGPYFLLGCFFFNSLATLRIKPSEGFQSHLDQVVPLWACFANVK